MIFIIFFICVPLVSSELHTFITSYTGINGKTTAGIPEFSAVSSLDGQQIDYYDSDTMELIPRQDWMKEFGSEDMWTQDTDIRKHVQQVYKNNIPVLMERFNQTDGVHTYQRMYGCEWDDETEDIQGFDEYGYDGEDFISLDLKELRYITPVAQGLPTVQKWNDDRAQLEYLKQYYEHECVDWLKKLLHLSKAAFKKTGPPKVSLLQKNPDNYTCHVTGFLFRNTTISWRKIEGDMSDSVRSESGETLPNEDGTFQRNLTLFVLPDEWKKSQYTCVVEHQSLTEPIQRILTVNAIKRNNLRSDPSDLMSLVLLVIIIVVLIGLIVLWKHRKAFKAYKTKMFIYVKNQRSHQEHGEALNPQSPLQNSVNRE